MSNLTTLTIYQQEQDKQKGFVIKYNANKGKMLPETISYYNNATKCIIILAVKWLV